MKAARTQFMTLNRVGQLCAFLTLLLGALGLAGWLFDQPVWRSVWKSGPEMKFNTALALTALGSALVLANTLKDRARYAIHVAVSVPLLVATLTLIQYAFSINLGIDELVFRDTNPLGTSHAGRMAWHSALTFLALSVGTLWLQHQQRRSIYAAQWVALAAMLFPILALVGYAYSTMAVFGMSSETGYMAVPTAGAFICAALALLFRAPDRGIMATLTAPTRTSGVFRGLLPFLLILPLALGWLTLHVAHGVEHPPAYSVATVATFTTILLTALAWLAVFRLNSAEREIKHAEEAKAKLAAIVQHSDDAIVSKDLNSIITSWNRGAEHLFGYTAEEAIGQSILMIIPIDRQYEEPQIIERMRKGETMDHYETIRRRRDGTLVDISLTVSPIRDERGNIIGVSKIARNITDRKRTEAALVKAQEELQQHAATLEKTVEQRTAKLRETIGELESYSYSISHDMRGPLRAMQAYAQVLLSDYGTALDAPARRYLDRIMASSHRLDKLIQDVLSYSRISRGDVRLEPVNLDRLVQDIIDEYPAVRAAEVNVRQPLGSVVAAEALLTQTISNLMTNAAKFVVVGQTPRIKVWSETIPSNNSTPATIKLCIQDHGIGIAPEDQQRIFGIFARVHSEKEYEGTGIGLSIVKKSVERMGGEVSLTSELGKGSTFCLYLPRA